MELSIKRAKAEDALHASSAHSVSLSTESRRLADRIKSPSWEYCRRLVPSGCCKRLSFVNTNFEKNPANGCFPQTAEIELELVATVYLAASFDHGLNEQIRFLPRRD